MRLSTAQIYDSGTSGLLRNQYDLYRLQNQLSTGRRIVTPADDPVAASQALVTTQKISVNAQFMDNQGAAKNVLAELESQLGAMDTLLIDVKARWVEAGNGVYTDKERQALAVDLRQRFEELLGHANSVDATGLSIFSGYKGNTQAFSLGSSGAEPVTYNGDDGRRQLQVESGRYMDVSLSGMDVFMRIKQGNGEFTTTASNTNTGTGIIDNGTNVTGYNGDNFKLYFESVPDPANPNEQLITYAVTTWAPGAAEPAAPATPYSLVYEEGEPIYLPDPTTPGVGISVSLTGEPETGDTFTVAPSQNQSVFRTLDELITALETPMTTAPTADIDANKALYQNQLNSIGANIDQALQHILDQRSVVGAQLAELDTLTSVSGDLDVQLQGQLSSYQDLDYTKAISDLAKEQLQLQAAQQSFLKVTSLSLFNFL